MQRRSSFSVLWLVAAALVGGSVVPAAAQTGTVRCESRGSDREQCAIDRGARVELARHLSQTPCQQNSNWGVGQGFIWVSGGCRAEFQVTALGAYPEPGQGNAAATPMQLRACRSEADRRLPSYTYDQIRVEGQSRQGSTAWVRWQAGNTGGTCTVASSGRIVAFATDGAGGGGSVMPAATRITCESRSTDRQECPIPSGSQVRLARQISQNPCRENDTYGQGDGYLWVAKGCRGEFEVSRTTYPAEPGAGTTQIRCGGSKDFRTECPIPAGSSARLVQQTSQASCRLGQSYGVTDSAIWVSRGCIGLFEVTRAGPSAGNAGYTTRVTCESQETARRECPIAGASQVRLVRQLSSNACTLNRSYGVGTGHIWVSNGCRGEFDVTTGGQVTYPADGGGLPGSPGLGERVTCESKGGDRTECPIRRGAQVRLLRQLSTTACTAGSTWGTSSGVLWVARGCRGEFEVR